MSGIILLLIHFIDSYSLYDIAWYLRDSYFDIFYTLRGNGSALRRSIDVTTMIVLKSEEWLFSTFTSLYLFLSFFSFRLTAWARKIPPWRMKLDIVTIVSSWITRSHKIILSGKKLCFELSFNRSLLHPILNSDFANYITYPYLYLLLIIPVNIWQA